MEWHNSNLIALRQSGVIWSIFFEEPLSGEGVKRYLKVGVPKYGLFSVIPVCWRCRTDYPALWKVFAVLTQRHGTLGNEGEPWCGILIDGPTFR